MKSGFNKLGRNMRHLEKYYIQDETNEAQEKSGYIPNIHLVSICKLRAALGIFVEPIYTWSISHTIHTT